MHEKPDYSQITLIAALALITSVFVSCSSKSKMEGTYSQAGSGMGIVLDLKSGDKATFSMSGEDFACTYRVTSDKLALDCSPKGESWTSRSTMMGRSPGQAWSGY